MQRDDSKTRSYSAYMERIGEEQIPVYEPILGEEEKQNLISVIDSNWISEGEWTRRFEQQLADINQRQHALCVANATGALMLGLRSLGIGLEDEVIVPSFSHSADANSISAVGAKPIFSDVDRGTLCLSVSQIDRLVTKRTKAVLYVCAYGSPGELNAVESYCNEIGIHLINDSAPALFGMYRDKPIPAYGIFSVLSFFADKTITTGEGGMLLTDDERIIDESNILKNDGRKERGHNLIERKGYNFRITEFQSAIGLAQLAKSSLFVKRKIGLLSAYQKYLKDCTSVTVFSVVKNSMFVPHRVLIFTSDAIALIQHLVSCGVGGRRLFRPMHSQPSYNVEGEFPASEALYSEGLELPSSPTLTDDQVRYICKLIKDYKGESR